MMLVTGWQGSGRVEHLLRERSQDPEAIGGGGRVEGGDGREEQGGVAHSKISHRLTELPRGGFPSQWRCE
jgi:hypothetical protein